MGKENLFCVVMLCLKFDRLGNHTIIRGGMPFFGHPIAEIMGEEVLSIPNAKLVYYLIRKENIFTNEFKTEHLEDKRIKIIYKPGYEFSYHEHLIREMVNLFKLYDNIIVMDTKYPLLSRASLESLFNYHLEEKNDFTILYSTNKGKPIYGNVVALNEKGFLTFAAYCKDFKNANMETFKNTENLNLKVGSYNLKRYFELVNLTNEKAILTFEKNIQIFK